MFVELGEVALDHHTGLLITVDEVHDVHRQTLEALIMGLHRATQLVLPITIAGAGSPSLAGLTGEAKSYAERMFTFPAVGPLDDAQSREALEVPARDEGVMWSANTCLPRWGEIGFTVPMFDGFMKRWNPDVSVGPGRLGDSSLRNLRE